MVARSYRSYEDYQSDHEWSGKLCDLRSHCWHSITTLSREHEPHHMEESLNQACTCLGTPVWEGCIIGDSWVSQASAFLSAESGHHIFPFSLTISLENHYIARVNNTPVSCNSNRAHAKMDPGSWLSRFTLGHHIGGYKHPTHVELVGFQQYLWRNESFYNQAE